MGKLKKKETSSIFHAVKHNNAREFVRWSKETKIRCIEYNWQSISLFRVMNDKKHDNVLLHNMLQIAKNSYLPNTLKRTTILYSNGHITSTSPFKKRINPYWKFCRVNTYGLTYGERMHLADELEKYGIVLEVSNTALRKRDITYRELLACGQFLVVNDFGFCESNTVYYGDYSIPLLKNADTFIEYYKKGVLWELYMNMSPIDKLRYKLLKVFNPKKVEI